MQLPQEISTLGKMNTYDRRTIEELKVKSFNADIGDMSGYNCPICKNKGLIAFVAEDGYLGTRECSCRRIRALNNRLRKSGLFEMAEGLNWDSYIDTESWQTNIKNRAKEYSKHPEGWFYIGGQVGAGKSLICTILSKVLMENDKDLIYMLWRDESRELKSKINDDSYSKRIEELKTAEVLYIDDFLKVKKGEMPTTADVNLAFEIINARYINKLPTIISSEWTTNEILNQDEATGSRIFERTKGYRLNIAKDQSKNYRLRG